MGQSRVHRFKSVLQRQVSRFIRAIRLRYQRLPRRHKKIIKLVTLGLAIISIAQLLYPSSRMLPNTRIGGKSYSFAPKAAVLQDVGKIGSDARVTVSAADQKLTTSMNDMGIRIDAPKTLQPALQYPWYWRLVPLTIFLPHNTPDYAVQSDNAGKTKQFVTSLKKFDVPPTNANLSVQGTEVTVVPDKTGLSYSGGNQENFITKARLTPAFTIILQGEVTQPKVTTKAAEKAAELARKQISTQFTVSVENQVVTVQPADLASWIATSPDEAKGQLIIGYDKEKIKTFLQPYADKVYVAGVAKKVSTLDGQVVNEIAGSPGKAMKLDASVDEVVKALTASQGSAKTIVQAVTPVQVVSASYTRSSKGLQALINDWVKNHKGSYNIALKTLDGNISAGYNAGAKVYPASIYKLYLADAAYTKAANGQFNLQAELRPGRSAATCIDLMIVRSDNDCSYAVGDAIGWEANNGLLAAQGFGSTTLKRQSWNTTANDTVNFLLKLQRGQLLNSEHTNALLGMMSRQIYRSGIPAGSAGGVAGKVGFIDSYNHDAGIVYHPNGTYALVVMTTNSSFANIADLSRQISNVMKQ